MTNLDGVVQMLRKEHARLTKQMTAITAALSAFGSAYATNGTGRRKISAAGRARIAAAQETTPVYKGDPEQTSMIRHGVKAFARSTAQTPALLLPCWHLLFR
jgi:hypothetical protein